MPVNDQPFNLRMPVGLKEEIVKTAKENNHSINAEIVFRLDDSFKYDLAGYEYDSKAVANKSIAEIEEIVCLISMAASVKAKELKNLQMEIGRLMQHLHERNNPEED